MEAFHSRQGIFIEMVEIVKHCNDETGGVEIIWQRNLGIGFS